MGMCFDKEGGIRIPEKRYFAVFPGQGIRLGSTFGVVRRIFGDKAVVFFPEGECDVPIRELQRPVDYGDEGLSGDDRTANADDLDADPEEAVLDEEQDDLLEVGCGLNAKR